MSPLRYATNRVGVDGGGDLGDEGVGVGRRGAGTPGSVGRKEWV